MAEEKNEIREAILDSVDVSEFPKMGFLEGKEFDKAIIGVEQKEGAVIYSLRKLIEVLCEDGMSEEEAWDWYDYNIEGIRGNINFFVCNDTLF